MSNIYIILSLVWYFVLCVFIYYFIYKRLDFITKRHIRNSKVQGIDVIYKKLLKIIFILFLMMYLSWTYLILLYF